MADQPADRFADDPLRPDAAGSDRACGNGALDGKENAMRHLLFASAAALLLAACDTVPPGESYPPNYPGDAYPPAPYPPDQGYPPPDYPPQGQYPPGPDLSCPISTSRDWRAWVNAMPGPGARPMLIVTGKVQTPTGGYYVSFDRELQIRKSYPAQAFATLRAAPPTQPATQAVVIHDLRGEWPLSGPVGSVEIRCGSETLATIAPVETAR
jgi:hypothetical protein